MILFHFIFPFVNFLKYFCGVKEFSINHPAIITFNITCFINENKDELSFSN